MAEPQRCWVSNQAWRENLAELGERARRMAAREQRKGAADLGERLRLAADAVWLLAPAVSDPATVARSCQASCTLGVPVLIVPGPVDALVGRTRELLLAAQGADLAPLLLPHPPAQLPTDRLAGAAQVPLPAIGRPPELATEPPAADPDPPEPATAAAAPEPAPIDPEPPAAPEPAAPPEGDGEWIGSTDLEALCPHGRSKGAAWLFIKRHGGPDVMRLGGSGWEVHRDRARQLLGSKRPNRKLAELSDEQRQAHQRELRKRWASRRPKQQHADAECEPDGLDALLAAVRSDAEGEP